MIYDKHVFICTNERKNNERLSCGEKHGLELTAAFKKKIKDQLLNTNIRTSRCGCLGICDFGPTVAIYPEGIFYVGVTLADVDEIIQSHLVNNVPVERLLLKKK
ncbi:MAG: (2Fe-2S) ferredoxin domain-containing protein [Sphingobacteriaceae bacterium]|nr:(2Fe-2S) ferredoxin domain-containing protein [Sphingobacteriaceae bacterium]